jgi:hypothetical protein
MGEWSGGSIEASAMKRHTVNIADLDGYSFEHKLCASYGRESSKSLVAHVDGSTVFYKVYEHREPLLRTASLEEAINFYNELR